jgi:hypothetical protein
MAIECEETKLLLEKEQLEREFIKTNDEKDFTEEVKCNESITKLEFKLNDLKKKIQFFIKFKHMLKHYWLCFYRYILSSTQFYCFFAMILAHAFGGSIITVVYPISVFIYALTEHCRPRWNYWSLILLYTEVILALKLILQLDAIELLIDSKENMNEKYCLNKYRLGLRTYEYTMTAEFIRYVIFDCLIVVCILTHQYVLVFTGVHEKREVDQESIEKAIDRILAGQREYYRENEVEVSFKGGQSIHERTLGNKAEESSSEEKDPEEEQGKKTKKSRRQKIKELLVYVAFENDYAKTLFPRLKVKVQ